MKTLTLRQSSNPRGRIYSITGWQSGVQVKLITAIGSPFYAKDCAFDLLKHIDVDQVQITDEESNLLLDLKKISYSPYSL